MHVDLRRWMEGDLEVSLITSKLNQETLLQAEKQVTTNWTLAANATDDNDRELLEDNGFELVFTTIEMDLHPVPSFLRRQESRNPARDEIEKLQQLNTLVYKEREYSQTGTNESVEEFMQGATDLSLWFTTWNNDEPIGFVFAKQEGDQAEVLEVSVDPNHQRQGIATALLTDLLNELHNRDVKTVRLKTNGENVSGARSLYEKFGFETVNTHYKYRKRIN